MFLTDCKDNVFILSLQRDASELCFIINIDLLEMKKEKTINQETKVEIGDFGPIYRQFERKPKEAIEYLCKMKDGDQHKGYGLAHIIDKHGDDIKALGFSLEQFIPILVKYGDLAESKDPDKIILKGNNFKIIISKKAYKNNRVMNKTFVLTSFSIK